MLIKPITFKQANDFVKEHHRHHPPMPGCKFVVGVFDGDSLVGVAMAGRPVARMLDDGFTLEVNRTCTIGDKNANSMLYGAVWRVAKALGYERCITYTLPEESGASLRAVGWTCDGEKGGGSWSRPSRKRTDKAPTAVKLRWRIERQVND